MDARKVKEKAKKLGLKVKDMSTETLIRGIQIAEGNIPCFRSGVSECSQVDCCWREICLVGEE